ncbi:response regulator [Sphingomonas sp. SRS2]|uniref:response regulator n=1 Tax=Sphingomonas sp. SRS2 TaxID=133190 RepID=UPI0006183EF2|nr:response regulator [Sphingomonas sp. SRS2]KKC24804.1 hypothetical protein WP12_17605 [Sphingomonas sp. SRS2]
MGEQLLARRRILVVEDEYFLADDLDGALTDAGAKVLGPLPSVKEAARFIASEPSIDAAVLDINLHGEMVFPVADALRERGIPFAFATGYDQLALPARFADVPRIEKPFKSDRLAAVLGPMIAT